jgi:hypothetical protein
VIPKTKTVSKPQNLLGLDDEEKPKPTTKGPSFADFDVMVEKPK